MKYDAMSAIYLAVFGVAALAVVALPRLLKMDNKEREVAELALKREEENGRAQRFLKYVTYVKDPRTGGCFALYSVSFATTGHRDFATAVPCDGIPTNMLIIPDMGINTNTIAK